MFGNWTFGTLVFTVMVITVTVKVWYDIRNLCALVLCILLQLLARHSFPFGFSTVHGLAKF